MYRLACLTKPGIVLAAILTLLLPACGESQNQSENIIQGINFVGLAVADLERSSKFYRESANLEPAAEEPTSSLGPVAVLAGTSDSAIESRLLKSSNAQLRLMQFPSQATDIKPVPVEGPGIAHVCYQVNQETRTYERFLEAGATHIGAREMVLLNPKKPVQYAYAYDLDGAIVEIEHVDVAALNLDTPPANDYRIRHVSLATPDIGGAIEFYSKLLGGQKARRAGRFFSLSGEKLDQISGKTDAKIKMAWFQTRNLELEIIQYTSHQTEAPKSPRPVNAPGYNMIVFDVTDIEKARATLLAAGGTVVGKPENMDGGEILFGRDPDGNLLGFQVVAAEAAVSSRNFRNNGL